MRRLLFVTNPNCGGADRMTLLYMKLLKSAGFAVRLCVCMNNGSKFNLKPFIPSDVQYDIIPYQKYRYLIFKLVKYLWQQKFDVIITSLPLLAQPILILKKLSLIQSKVVYRECNMPSSHDMTEMRLAKILYRHADVLISQTAEMKEEMIKYYSVESNDVITINNPVDKDLIQQKIKESVTLDSNRVNYMACSRLSPQKDIPTMLMAFAVVRKTIPNAMLYLIGKPDSEEYGMSLKSLTCSLGISEYVKFVGFQANPYKYLKQADVFVLSSIYEGLPNVMLEAMYLGKPVAVTACIPYISQVVHSGVNGYLAPVSDSDALAKAMVEAKDIKGLPQYKDINDSEGLIVKMFRKL